MIELGRDSDSDKRSGSKNIYDHSKELYIQDEVAISSAGH